MHLHLPRSLLVLVAQVAVGLAIVPHVVLEGNVVGREVHYLVNVKLTETETMLEVTLVDQRNLINPIISKKATTALPTRVSATILTVLSSCQ